MNYWIDRIITTIKYHFKLGEFSYNETRKSLKKRRENGGCGMNGLRIPIMVKIGKWNELLDWEKEYFLNGVKENKWNEED